MELLHSQGAGRFKKFILKATYFLPGLKKFFA